MTEVGSTANQYQLLGRLASGGMAEIFLARGTSSTGVQRYCVLKRILRDRASDTALVTMFLDEARLAAQLQHPNVAQVLDIGRLGSSYFFTMEYVHGETVRALLQQTKTRRESIPVAAALTIIAGAAAGLHHAHERLAHDGRPLGIVHRDVSPSNLMVTYEGGVKVVDFGVAKAEDRATETRSGAVKGKIGYLSPEQCRGELVDRRSDVYSLGIVLWELLALERLYKRASDFENMTAIATEDAPSPSSRRPGVPREVDALVARMLAKRPADRFQTAEAVVLAVEEVAAAVGATLSPSALGRLMRERFGTRPEPWLALPPSDEPAPRSVTVTSHPVPDELVVAEDPVVDAAIADVPLRPIEAPRTPRRRALWMGVIAGGIVVGSGAAWLVRTAPVPERAAAAVALAIDAPTMADAAPVLADVPAPADASVDDPARALAERRIGDAMTLCEHDARAHLRSCVVAACQLRRADRARGWIAALPTGERRAAAASCAALRGGGPVARDAGVVDPCEADPMACQR